MCYKYIHQIQYCMGLWNILKFIVKKKNLPSSLICGYFIELSWTLSVSIKVKLILNPNVILLICHFLKDIVNTVSLVRSFIDTKLIAWSYCSVITKLNWLLMNFTCFKIWSAQNPDMFFRVNEKESLFLCKNLYTQPLTYLHWDFKEHYL